MPCFGFKELPPGEQQPGGVLSHLVRFGTVLVDGPTPGFTEHICQALGKRMNCCMSRNHSNKQHSLKPQLNSRKPPFFLTKLGTALTWMSKCFSPANQHAPGRLWHRRINMCFFPPF